MNTSRPTPFPSPAMPAPFHSSVHTVLSQNTDMDSGLYTQVLITSKLELSWAPGNLVIRGRVSRVEFVRGSDPTRPRLRPRGAL